MVPYLIRLIDANCTNAAIKLILSGCDCNEYDTWGRSPLFAAVAGKHLDLVELLLAKGCDCNAVLSANLVSPLMFVLRTFDPKSNDNAILMALLQSGANVNAKTVSGVSVYDIARESVALPKSFKLLLLMHGAHATAITPTVTGTISLNVHTAPVQAVRSDFCGSKFCPEVKGTIEVTTTDFNI